MGLAGGQTQDLDSIFEALADVTRRSMLDRLRQGPLSITALARPYSMSLNGVSKHIKKLEKAGLIRRHIKGREHLCALDAGGMRDAMDWMNHYAEFWGGRIDALENYLAGKEKREGQ